MKTKIIIVAVAIAITIAVYYIFYSTKQKRIVDAQLAQPQTGTTGTGTNDLLKAAQDIALANAANKAITTLTGTDLAKVGMNAIKDALGLGAGATSAEVAAGLQSAAASLPAGEVAAAGEALHGSAAVATASSPLEAIGGVAVENGAATAGLSGAAAVGIALVPLAAIIAIAADWGVFDEFDPHRNMTYKTISDHVADVTGHKHGFGLWIPNSVADKIDALKTVQEKEMYWIDFLMKDAATIEARNKAIALADVKKPMFNYQTIDVDYITV